jgi:hypothetical protein
VDCSTSPTQHRISVREKGNRTWLPSEADWGLVSHVTVDDGALDGGEHVPVARVDMSGRTLVMLSARIVESVDAGSATCAPKAVYELSNSFCLAGGGGAARKLGHDDWRAFGDKIDPAVRLRFVPAGAGVEVQIVGCDRQRAEREGVCRTCSLPVPVAGGETAPRTLWTCELTAKDISWMCCK